MRIIALDFETFFSDEYTLKKLTTEAYIRDPRFEAHGAAIKWGPNHAARWYDARQLKQVLAEEDWSDVAIIAHHAHFDGFILGHHYAVRPRLWLDTLSMARLLLGNHLSVGLDSVRKHFGLPAKRTPYEVFKGKRWPELTRAEQELIADGCCDEVESIWTLFQTLAKSFPAQEYEVVDITTRMFTEPVLRADTELLGKVWTDEQRRKRDLLGELGISAADCGSAERFAALLRAEGVEPLSKDGGRRADGQVRAIPAFAKTDQFMTDLLEDENPRVRALAEARLGIKSTLVQTRAETLGWMGSRGPLPVYLKYCAAHTTRWGGGDKANWQNSVEAINAAVCAPDGFLLASPDASQIECRILNWIAGQHDKVEDFRLGRDPYVGVASEFYGKPINKQDHPVERQVGKVLELQCGYGSGGDKICATLRTKANIVLTPSEGLRARDAYRDTHPAVCALWSEAGNVLNWINGGLERDWGPVHIADRRMWLPNGAPIIYETLEWHRSTDDDGQLTGDDYWRLRTRRGWTKMYGARLVENLCQALARVVVSQAMVRIARRGYKIFNMRHDDVGVLIPKGDNAQAHLQVCIDEMRAPVSWLPGCPLDAEGELSERYS